MSDDDCIDEFQMQSNAIRNRLNSVRGRTENRESFVEFDVDTDVERSLLHSLIEKLYDRRSQRNASPPEPTGSSPRRSKRNSVPKTSSGSKRKASRPTATVRATPARTQPLQPQFLRMETAFGRKWSHYLQDCGAGGDTLAGLPTQPAEIPDSAITAHTSNTINVTIQKPQQPHTQPQLPIEETQHKTEPSYNLAGPSSSANTTAPPPTSHSQPSNTGRLSAEHIALTQNNRALKTQVSALQQEMDAQKQKVKATITEKNNLVKNHKELSEANIKRVQQEKERAVLQLREEHKLKQKEWDATRKRWEQTNHNLQQKLDAVREENSEYTRKSATLLEKIASQNKELEVRQSKITQLQQQHVQYDTKLQELNTTIEEIHLRETHNATNFRNQEFTLKQEKEQQEERIFKLQQKVENLQQEQLKVDVSKSKMEDAHSHSIQEYQKKVDELTRKLDATYTKLKDKAAKLKKEKEVTRSKADQLSELEQHNMDLKCNVEKIQREFSAKEGAQQKRAKHDIQQLQGDKQTLQGQINLLETELSTLKSTTAQLHAQLETTKKEKTDLQQQNQQLRAHKDELAKKGREATEAHNSKCDSLVHDKEQLQQQYHTLQNQMTKVTVAKERIDAEYEDLKQKYKGLQGENKRLLTATTTLQGAASTGAMIKQESDRKHNLTLEKAEQQIHALSQLANDWRERTETTNALVEKAQQKIFEKEKEAAYWKQQCHKLDSRMNKSPKSGSRDNSAPGSAVSTPTPRQSSRNQQSHAATTVEGATSEFLPHATEQRQHEQEIEQLQEEIVQEKQKQTLEEQRRRAALASGEQASISNRKMPSAGHTMHQQSSGISVSSQMYQTQHIERTEHSTNSSAATYCQSSTLRVHDKGVHGSSSGTVIVNGRGTPIQQIGTTTTLHQPSRNNRTTEVVGGVGVSGSLNKVDRNITPSAQTRRQHHIVPKTPPKRTPNKYYNSSTSEASSSNPIGQVGLSSSEHNDDDLFNPASDEYSDEDEEEEEEDLSDGLALGDLQTNFPALPVTLASHLNLNSEATRSQ